MISADIANGDARAAAQEGAAHGGADGERAFDADTGGGASGSCTLFKWKVVHKAPREPCQQAVACAGSVDRSNAFGWYKEAPERIGAKQALCAER